jgi:hypothetical protein
MMSEEQLVSTIKELTASFGTRRTNVAYCEDGIALPTKSGEVHWIAKSHMAEWQMTYKRLNVRQEVLKMKAWLEANPSKRKVNTHRFVVNWLNKADSLPGNPGETTARAAAGYRERIHAEAEQERAKPEASAEIARKAIAEAMRMLGKGHDAAKVEGA